MMQPSGFSQQQPPPPSVAGDWSSYLEEGSLVPREYSSSSAHHVPPPTWLSSSSSGSPPVLEEKAAACPVAWSPSFVYQQQAPPPAEGAAAAFAASSEGGAPPGATDLFHRVPLGEKGRMELKAAIRAAIKDRPELRDRVNSIAKLRCATIPQLLKIASICDLWRKALDISRRFVESRNGKSSQRQSLRRSAAAATTPNNKQRPVVLKIPPPQQDTQPFTPNWSTAPPTHPGDILSPYTTTIFDSTPASWTSTPTTLPPEYDPQHIFDTPLLPEFDPWNTNCRTV